jgi:hypothetical protein
MDHLKVIKILIQEPHDETGVQFPSLLFNLPGMNRDLASDLIKHLNSLCVTEIKTEGSLLVLTPFGKRLTRYIMEY